MTRRLKGMGQVKYADGFNVIKMHAAELDRPATWTKPQLVFVDSMSDLFHDDVTLEFIKQVFAVMVATPQHTYQVLTKRIDRAMWFQSFLPWPDNVWLGTSVEDERVSNRIDALRVIQAKTRFLSLEPLIGPLPNLNLTGIDWVIVGGESGKMARPAELEWILSIIAQCRSAGVPVFVKQMGSVLARQMKLSSAKGGEIDEWPEHLRVREMPFRL
jgi:protein gp37